MNLDRLIDRLRRIAAPVKTWDCYWFSSEFDAAGNDWCLDCAKKRTDELREKHPDVFIDGGFSIEHDSAPFCNCGRRLEGSLTDYGISSELEHYSTYRFRKMTPDRAFEIVRILEMAPYVKNQNALRVLVERTKQALKPKPKTGGGNA